MENTSSIAGASRQVSEAASSWDGVTSGPHRFGGVEFRLGTREIGHMHGDHLLDIPFPRRVRDELVAAGEAEPHHVLPESGWVSFHLHEAADVQRAIALLRRSYEIAARQASAARQPGPQPPLP